MANSGEESFKDERVLALAAEVSKAVPTLVPRLLVQLQDILDSYKGRVGALLALKSFIWEYELPLVLVAALKQDLSRVIDGWNVASRLSNILVSCCVGFNPLDVESFRTVILPDVLESLLMISCKLQKRFIRTSLILEDVRNQLLASFRGVFESVSFLLAGYKDLATSTLQSAWFLQMLLTDDSTTGLRVMSLLQSLTRAHPGLLGQIDVKISHQILDELIFKLSATTNAEVASCAAHSLLLICESHPPAIQLILSRYRGLKLLLTQWIGKPFVKDLERLVETGNMHAAAMQKFVVAAQLIQAWWRSYSTRKQLKKADSAIAKLQRSFRMKKEMENRRRENAKMESELHHMLLMQRKYTMRQLHKRQLCALEIVPASEISKHLANEQTKAALRIQAIWKGYRIRQGLETKKLLVRGIKAAIKIQRAVRKWLERIHARKLEASSWQRPPGLTDERRVELQEKIMEWRETHQVARADDGSGQELQFLEFPCLLQQSKLELQGQIMEWCETHQVAQRSRDEQEILHNKVQDMIKCNVILSKVTRRKQQHREALLGTIDMDANLLLNAPTLSNITETELGMFRCHSVPTATKARQNHVEEMLLLQQPWWRKLGNEYQDSEYVEESDDWKLF